MPCIEAVASARIEALQLQALIISDSSTITHLWQLEQVYILVFGYSKRIYSKLWLNKVSYCKRWIECSWIENLSCSSRSSYYRNMSKGSSCYSTLWELNECSIRKWSSTICPVCSLYDSLTCIVCVCCFVGRCRSCFSWICCIECKIKVSPNSPRRICSLKNCFENIILGCIGLRHSVKISN